MAKNKKPRKLADRLHDRPQTSLVGSPGESAAPPQADARPAQASRAVSGEVDMDIDGGSASPVKGPSILAGINPPSRAAVDSTTAFNPNQDDFMSLDILDDDEEESPPPSRFQKRAEQRSGPSGNRAEPRAFPDRGLDKGKGRATDSAMVCLISDNAFVPRSHSSCPSLKSAPSVVGSWPIASLALGVLSARRAIEQDTPRR